MATFLPSMLSRNQFAGRKKTRVRIPPHPIVLDSEILTKYFGPELANPIPEVFESARRMPKNPKWTDGSWRKQLRGLKAWFGEPRPGQGSAGFGAGPESGTGQIFAMSQLTTNATTQPKITSTTRRRPVTTPTIFEWVDRLPAMTTVAVIGA